MRSFTIIKIISNDKRIKNKKSFGGRFISENPSSAAKKAGSSICKHYNIKSAINFKIAIRETTSGSSHKIFMYKFSRTHNPTTVMRSGRPITYEFETKVESLKHNLDGQVLTNPFSSYPSLANESKKKDDFALMLASGFFDDDNEEFEEELLEGIARRTRADADELRRRTEEANERERILKITFSKAAAEAATQGVVRRQIRKDVEKEKERIIKKADELIKRRNDIIDYYLEDIDGLETNVEKLETELEKLKTELKKSEDSELRNYEYIRNLEEREQKVKKELIETQNNLDELAKREKIAIENLIKSQQYAEDLEKYYDTYLEKYDDIDKDRKVRKEALNAKSQTIFFNILSDGQTYGEKDIEALTAKFDPIKENFDNLKNYVIKKLDKQLIKSDIILVNDDKSKVCHRTDLIYHVLNQLKELKLYMDVSVSGKIYNSPIYILYDTILYHRKEGESYETFAKRCIDEILKIPSLHVEGVDGRKGKKRRKSIKNDGKKSRRRRSGKKSLKKTSRRRRSSRKYVKKTSRRRKRSGKKSVKKSYRKRSRK